MNRIILFVFVTSLFPSCYACAIGGPEVLLDCTNGCGNVIAEAMVFTTDHFTGESGHAICGDNDNWKSTIAILRGCIVDGEAANTGAEEVSRQHVVCLAKEFHPSHGDDHHFLFDESKVEDISQCFANLCNIVPRGSLRGSSTIVRQ